MAESDKKPPGSEERIRLARGRLGKRGEATPTQDDIPDAGHGVEETSSSLHQHGSGSIEGSDSGRLVGQSDYAPGKERTEPTAQPGASTSKKEPWYLRRWVRVLGWSALAIIVALVRGGLFGGTALAVGDCFDSEQLLSTGPEIELSDVDGVSCDGPHTAETFATFDYSSNPADEFPGTDALGSFAARECAPALEAYIDGDGLDSGFDVVTLIPTSEAWDAGDKTVKCTLVRLDGQKATGSAEDVGAVVPAGLVSFLRLAEGDCVDLSDWLSFGDPKTCSDSHDLEIFAVLTIPSEAGAPYSSVDEIVGNASNSCAGAFQSRVDPSNRDDLGFAPVAFPTPFTWELGHRTYVCGLFSPDTTKLEGSRLLAFSRHSDLVSDEFTDTPLLIDFDDFSDVESLELVGSAHLAGPVLAVTKFAEHADRGVPFEQERPQRGAAWWNEPISVDEGFVTAFVFQFEMYSWFTVGDGLAFVVQGGDSEALGVGIGYDGMPNSLAVEFDTLKEDWLSDPRNNVPGAPDLLGNHVSVQTRGVAPNDTHTDASLGWANIEGFHMADRAAHVALIVYEPGDLRVYVDDFETPVLSVVVDLAETLALEDGKAYVGFTASSGPEISRGPRTLTITGHKILAWEMAPLD